MEGVTTAQYKPRLPPLKLFINGQFVDSTTKKTFPVVQPASEEVIAHVPEAGKEDVDAAVNAAHAALKGEWGRLGPEGRRDLLLKLAAVLERDADDLSKLESYCNGGPLAFQTAVVKGLASDVRYYAGWCEKVDGRTPRCPPDVFAYTRREPIGVCGLILPWNVPLWALVVKLAPCLSQGNAVIVKPAEQTPLTTLRVAELFNEVGFPPGVLNIVTGYGQTGEFVSRHMNIQKVAFTGSTEVGRKIMKAAAESNLKKVQLELGGKSPLVILPDADLELAATIARTGVFFNNGQLCTSASRTFVHASIYDKFVEKAVLKAKEIQVGDQFVATQGPQIDKPQFEKVLDYIEKGKKEGAKLECGGSRVGAKGYFVAPTVFSNVTDDMIIAREEIFGPVQSIIKFNDISEVVERCNSTEYGLAAGIVSNDLNAVINLSNKIKAGTVWVNTYHVVFPYLEFGGFKQSGFGREGGVEGISEWTQTKTVIMNVPARM